PADYSASAGHRGQWEGPGVADAIQVLKNTIRAAGKHCGVLATGDENVQQRIEQGFRAIGLGLDAGLLLRSLRASLAAVGRDRTIRAALSLPSEPAAGTPTVSGRTMPFRAVFTGDFRDVQGR